VAPAPAIQAAARLLTAQACRGRERCSGDASPAWRQGARRADPV